MKRFRIREISRNPNAYHYMIEQRHTVLFFIHWWSTPEFEPPHRFYTSDAARNCILEHHPKAIIQKGIVWM